MKLFAEQKLPLEFLTLIYCLTQHDVQNSPIISKIDAKNMTSTWNFDQYQIDIYNPDLYYFQILNQLLEINKEIKQEHINDVISHINDENYKNNIKQKENTSILFSKNEINYEEYLEQYYFNITGSLKSIEEKNSLAPLIEDFKQYVDDNNNKILEMRNSTDYTYALERSIINQYKNHLREFLKKYPEIKLPTGIEELEKTANIHHDLQEMEYRHISERLKNGIGQKFSQIDKTMKEYFEACYHKHSIYKIQESISKLQYFYKFSTIIPLIEEPSVIKYINGETEDINNNFDSSSYDLVSKYQLALFIAGTQIIGKVCGDNVLP